MLLLKKINNNFVLAKDGDGKNVILQGKGLGFEKMPCTLNDLKRVERSYYYIDTRFYSMFNRIDDVYLKIANAICDYAKEKLGVALNSNLAITLADHISFTVERIKKGISINYGILYEIRYKYPRELEIGEKAIKYISQHFDIRLNQNEAGIIALHILEAENTSAATPKDDFSEILDDIIMIIEKITGSKLSQDSFNFYRFATHVQYLLDRKNHNKVIETENQQIFETVKSQYKQAYQCALSIKEMLISKYCWNDITDEELLYLMLHINRLCTSKGLLPE